MNQWNITSKYQKRQRNTKDYLEQRYKISSEEKSSSVLPINQFISTKDSEDLRMLAEERDVWKDFLKVICSA